MEFPDLFEEPGWTYSPFAYSSDQRGPSPLWIEATHFLTAIIWLLMAKDESSNTDFASHSKELDSLLRTTERLQRFFRSTLERPVLLKNRRGKESVLF